MRPFVISVMLGLPVLAAAQDVAQPDIAVTLAPNSEDNAFRLGGAAGRAATLPTTPTVELEPSSRSRLSLPLRIRREETARTEHSFGPATIFLSEGMEDGGEDLELGTILSRGQATAGLSITVPEREDEISRSQVYLDYALTDRFSVGLSGLVESERGDAEPLRQLGVNAEYTTQAGSYIQGGFAGAVDSEPVIGLSIGLRF